MDGLRAHGPETAEKTDVVVTAAVLFSVASRARNEGQQSGARGVIQRGVQGGGEGSNAVSVCVGSNAIQQEYYLERKKKEDIKEDGKKRDPLLVGVDRCD